MKAFSKEADEILLVGALALVCHAVATGLRLKIAGKPIAQNDLGLAKKFLQANNNVHLPLDYILKNGTIVHAADLKATSSIVDVGPKTVREFCTVLKRAKTIIWNGTAGIVEVPNGQAGTKKLGRCIGALGARSIVGGGDTVGFLYANKLGGGIDFISTGGGAMLALLAGEKLPGLEVLRKDQ